MDYFKKKKVTELLLEGERLEKMGLELLEIAL